MTEDKSLFVEFFGDYPVIRVLDFLIENDIFDYSKKDIGKNANVSWNTLETFWNNLEETGVVTFTRKVGKAQMYKIDKKNPVVKQLIELDSKLMKSAMEKIEPEKVKALA
jgi:predicted transcriptional regulator